MRVRIVKPRDSTGPPPTILYIHGGGWILGNAGTHDRLVRELAVGVNAAVVFVEYDRSPEAHYPVAIEQATPPPSGSRAHGAAEGLDASRLAVAGDSVGGNMTAALAILAKQRGDVRFRAPVDVLPGHRRGAGHRQLPRVRRWPLPHGQRHGLVLGRLPARPRQAR